MEKERFLEPIEKAFLIYEASPYDDAWRKMSYHDLVSAAAYKSKRAALLPTQDPKIGDDILDAINFLVFSWHQWKAQLDGRTQRDR